MNLKQSDEITQLSYLELISCRKQSFSSDEYKFRYAHVRSHVGWGGGCGNLSLGDSLKNGKPERENSKRTISANGGFGLLQMVSELDTGRCASEETRPERGWTRGNVPARMLGTEGGWMGGVLHRLEKGTSVIEDAGLRREVDCEIPRRLGRRMKHSL